MMGAVVRRVLMCDRPASTAPGGIVGRSGGTGLGASVPRPSIASVVGRSLRK